MKERWGSVAVFLRDPVTRAVAKLPSFPNPTPPRRIVRLAN